jgi:transcriptional regulator with XRE-family HTH domain
MTIVMPAIDLVRRRFRLLCSQLESEHGYGWKTKLAALADADASLIGKIEKGERDVGLSSLSEVIQNLRISPAFFYDPALGDEPDYRDFLQGSSERVVVDAAYPALDEFLATPYGTSLEPACVAYLRDARFGNGSPTVGMYRAIASEWQDQHRALPKLPASPVLEVVPSRGKPREKR